MVCYIIPTIATIIEFIRNRKKGQRNYQLNLMFLGSALFGIIDHLWNGELFLISANWMMDIALGFAITGLTIGSWGVIMSAPKIINSIRRISHQIGI